MTKRSSKNSSPLRPPAQPRTRSQRLLSLSLVPIVAGAVFIVTWALDISVIGSLDNQPLVGLFFILLGFVMSNAFQKLWRLALGWALIAGSDLLLMIPASDVVRYAAIAIGVIGLLLLIIEIAARVRQSQTIQKR
jgi:hypothetical protein